MLSLIITSCYSFKNAVEMVCAPKCSVGILNNTGLGSQENAVLQDTFQSSYVTSFVVVGVAFHHLILACSSFARLPKISVWCWDKATAKIQMNSHCLPLSAQSATELQKPFSLDCANICFSDFFILFWVSVSSVENVQKYSHRGFFFHFLCLPSTKITIVPVLQSKFRG